MSRISPKAPKSTAREVAIVHKAQAPLFGANAHLRPDQIKQLLYKWFFLLAFVATSSSIAIRARFEGLSLVDVISLPALALCFIFAAITAWRYPNNINRMERVIFRVLEAYFLTRVLNSFFFLPTSTQRGIEFNDIMPWMGVYILFTFWVFERRRALLEVAIFVGFGVCLAVGFFSTTNEVLPANYRLVFQQMLIANVAYAWIAYLFAWMTEAYTRENAKATMMQKMALTDPLTGVANRRQMELLLDEYEGKEKFGLLLLDLDNFKQVNDKYGHQIGDHVLVAAAEAMKDSLRAEEALGRWGGEEFLVVLPDVGLKEAKKIAERLRKAVATHKAADGPTITTSIGVVHGTQATDRNTLLDLVDKALYQAKEGGRDQVVCWVGEKNLY